MAVLEPDRDRIQEPWMWILIRIATEMPSFQSPAAAEAALRTTVMKEPCLLVSAG